MFQKLLCQWLKNMKQQQKKIVDGRFQIGILFDWIEKQKVSKDEQYIYMKIAYCMCQKFHRRSPNIGLEEFNMSRSTLTKYRNILIEKKWLKFTVTRKYSAYELLEPMNILDTFEFKGEYKDKVVKDNISEKKEELKKSIFN